MSGYKLSYFFAVCLTIGAFIAQFNDRNNPVAMKLLYRGIKVGAVGPAILLYGGLVLGLLGYLEYLELDKKLIKVKRVNGE